MNVIRDEPLRVINVNGSAAVSGDQQLIAAPGRGYELVISFVLCQNTTVTPTTFQFQAGGKPFLQTLAQNQGDGIAVQKPRGREWRCGDNNALQLNLSGANSHLYSVDYWVEPSF